jgi:hypothetical protein
VSQIYLSPANVFGAYVCTASFIFAKHTSGYRSLCYVGTRSEGQRTPTTAIILRTYAITHTLEISFCILHRGLIRIEQRCDIVFHQNVDHWRCCLRWLQFAAVSGCWGWFYRNNRPSVALQTVRSLAQSRYGRQVMQDRSVRSARLVCNAAVIRIDIYYSVMHYTMLGVAICE